VNLFFENLTLKEEKKKEGIAFAEWLKTFFPILSVEHSQWVIESQVSSEQLYQKFKEENPTQ
jgi:hypothetical protein